MPKFLGAGVRLEISDIQEEQVGAEQHHVLHGLKIRLGLCCGLILCFGFGHAILPQAVLFGKVLEEVFERGEGILDDHGGTPHETLAATAEDIGFRSIRVDVCEGRGVRAKSRAVANDSAGVVQDDSAGYASGNPSKLWVDIATARSAAGRLRGTNEEAAALAPEFGLLVQLASRTRAGIITNGRRL